MRTTRCTLRADIADERLGRVLRRCVPCSLMLRLGVGAVPASDAELRSFRAFARAGDPLADALAAEIRSLPRGDGRRRFQAALAHGLDAVDDPGPALVAFVEDVEAIPSWLDREQLALASRTMRRTGAWSTHAVLGSVSLMAGYVASRPAKVLMHTGNLDTKAVRRLTETAAWWTSVTDQGGLDRFAPGFKNTVRVRLMHAEVRTAMRRLGDWNEKAWDAPLNQSQCAGTVLLFSLVYLNGLRALGLRFTRAEREAVIHFWRYVGTVMGVDPVLLPVDGADAWRLLRVQAATEFRPDEDSRRLAQALTEALPTVYGVDGDDAASRLAAWLITGYHSALSRWALGARSADALGFAYRPAFTITVLATGAANFMLETARRAVPGGTRLSLLIGDRTRRLPINRYAARRKSDLAFIHDDTRFSDVTAAA